MSRAQWTLLTDEQLLAQCSVDTYRASGPGGQKRNKTSSAVRLRHGPTGLVVIAEESRSQHENRAKAVRRLRQAIHLQARDPVDGKPEAIAAALTPVGRLDVGRKDARFWPAAGAALDMLDAHAGRVAESAAGLGITTANLVAFLRLDPKVWQRANELRKLHGRFPLH
ncbi:MAG TPA: peptide chain release factor-like protein [Gemmataceae bacterium]|nr:peptide chain release factor-like protein [Gemmataceae bacterium]